MTTAHTISNSLSATARVIAFALAILVALGSAGEAHPVTVLAVPDSAEAPGALVEFGIEIVPSDATQSGRLIGFQMAVAFDTAVFLPYEGTLSPFPGCDWKPLHMDIIYPQEPGSPTGLLRFGSELDNSGQGDACGTSLQGRILTLTFLSSSDDDLAGAVTDLEFYWAQCTDNMLWTKDRDTSLISLQVRSADSEDVTDFDAALPSSGGAPDDCLDLIALEGTQPQRTVVFRGGRYQFAGDAPTDVPGETGGEALPDRLVLHQNYPNPFNPATTVRFDLQQRADWDFAVYDVAGRKIHSEQGTGGPGSVEVVWNSHSPANLPLPSGVYFIRVEALGLSAARKALLLK